MPSDFQITNIRDQANANSAITIASDGQITVNQNNPTVTLGSNATGFTGVKNIDVWHLNANLTGNQNPIEAQRYTRGSTSTGAMNLGTGMTLNGTGADDGKFTFPSTGIWRVESGINYYFNGVSRYIFSEIFVSTTGISGSFASKSLSRAFITKEAGTSHVTQTSAYNTIVTDVTTSGTSGTAITFNISLEDTGTTISGNPTYMESWFMFTRLGDT
ncbi:hypothetical protein [uncultured Mediterranean phage uvMED]|nr:hypothetical protein [uncultured Mediterranean phage uvMED]